MPADSRVTEIQQDATTESHHYKAFIGPIKAYDLVSASQFNLLTLLGLREHHTFLDIGCGSLRGGKLFIPYLLPGRYFGIEPEQWLIDEGIRREVGMDIINIKQPEFSTDNEFKLSSFGQAFDFILAQSIFSHASRHQISKCLREARNVMKESSIFVATFLEGKEDYSGDEWVYPDGITYTWNGMKDLVQQQGFVCQRITWPHPNGQTWMIISNEEDATGWPKPDFTSIAHFTKAVESSRHSMWIKRVRAAMEEVVAMIPSGEAFILVDDGSWETAGAFAGRCVPFLERDGQYWGPPADDGTAIRELERLRRAGATFIVFGWPCFWWLDHYPRLHHHLRSAYRCILENDRLIVFDLRR